MKKVITYGTFDMFHKGHYNILKRAKEKGDYLIVGVTGENYDVGRGKLSVRDSLAERIANVKASGFADQIIVEEYLGQKISDIIKYGVDAFVIGDDWKGKFDHLSEYCEMIYLPRTEGISSTQIREDTFTKYRIGIIADRCDDNMLVSEAKKVSGFSVDCVFAEDPDLADAFKDKYGLRSAFCDPESFFDCTDIVFVRTELKDRSRYIEQALRAKKHVVSDVPFSIDTEKERFLFDLAEENNVVLLHNLKILHVNVFVQLLWMIKAGLIGDVIFINCSASKKDKNVKQLLYELSASALTVIFSIMGIKYTGIKTRTVKEADEIEYLSMTLSYPKAEVVINIGNNIRIDNKVEIVGTKGTIRLGDNWWRADSFELIPTGEEQSKVYNINYDGNGFKFVIKDLQIMINEGRSTFGLMDRDLDHAITDVMQSTAG